jgi:TRAP-type transport system small permease protein
MEHRAVPRLAAEAGLGVPVGARSRARAWLAAADRVLMRAVRTVLMTLLVGMALVIFANVIVRYTHWGSLVWAEEAARYAMVWLTLLGAGPVLRIGGHIAIENLQDAMPGAAAMALRAAIVLLMAALALGLVVLGWQYMQRAQFQLTASLQIPFAYVYAAMPVGGVLLLWCTLAIAPGYVRGRRFERSADAAGHEEGVQL